MRFADAMKMKESTLKKFMRLHDFDEHLAPSSCRLPG